MMRLEEAVSAHLQPKLNNRLYPFLLPQNILLPAVVYLPVSVERLRSLVEDSGFIKQRLQFSCYATSYKEAVQTARIIQSELQNFNGPMAGLSIGSVLLMEEISDYEPDTEIYSVSFEFEFQFEEG
ncbi:hypothetical protein MFMK1_000793 [Metallumcola ferriviriculae]|uniref:DUF3168 domain-containing protein n=1 Tax=Metallumcola ferriviriculae TaxID=3039180 RepID=A0AAU0UKU0_9FIRM|nr:hypothetical protein MFMK1_000793 [Desulfitibacteraceae bacterium MK1]